MLLRLLTSRDAFSWAATPTAACLSVTSEVFFTLLSNLRSSLSSSLLKNWFCWETSTEMDQVQLGHGGKPGYGCCGWQLGVLARFPCAQCELHRSVL